MSEKFTVDEAQGDKLYKLIFIKFSPKRAMKIISKESINGKIHFVMYFGDLNPETGEFVTQKLEYKSTDEGATKGDFEEFIEENIFSKMPAGLEIQVKDLSEYQNLEEQISQGLDKGFLKFLNLGNA